MQTVIIKLLSMFFPLTLGYVLKAIGFFGPTDYKILAKITINVTLPCAVIASFGSQRLDMSLLGVAVVAFILNILNSLYAVLTSRPLRDKKLRCLDIMCVTGFNMGNFLIPFAQQFMGNTGVAVAALFDAGNSPMCTGGHYIVASSVCRTDGEKLTVRDVLRRLFTSVPLVVYILMILCVLLRIPIPAPVTQICQLTGSANAFVSMFMMGMMFEIRFNRAYLKEASFVLVRKYLFALAAAVVFYTLTPFDLSVRKVLVLCAFAPIPSLSAIFTERFKGDVGLCSFITSCSFIISSLIIAVLVAVL